MIGNDEMKRRQNPPWKIFARFVNKSQFHYKAFLKLTEDAEKYLCSRKFTKERNEMIATFTKYPFYLSACDSSKK